MRIHIEPYLLHNGAFIDLTPNKLYIYDFVNGCVLLSLVNAYTQLGA